MKLEKLANEMSFRKLNNINDSIEEARKNIKNNVNWAVTIRVMLIELYGGLKMIKVIGVRFKKAGKIYYFDPTGLNIEKGNYVVVETARGIEFGECVIGIKEIREEDIVAPLKECYKNSITRRYG